VPVDTLSKAQTVVTQPLSQTITNFDQASKMDTHLHVDTPVVGLEESDEFCQVSAS
jgi:hypothetical protein